MTASNDQPQGGSQTLSKVPEVALVFWVIKIASTTLGETAGDAVSMSMRLGYFTSSIVFAAVFVVACTIQIRAKAFNPYLYWVTIIATTTLGTTLADFADRSLGIGYAGGASLLLALLGASIAVWYQTLGDISAESITTPASETFYWVTIMFSQTLGTALGDWTADTAGLGYTGSMVIFGGLLGLIAVAHYRAILPGAAAFWAAFILTRPLGAVLGDFLDKPVESGGLALSRYSATLVLSGFILALILMFRQRAAGKAH